MTRDYLVGALTQLETQLKTATDANTQAGNQVQAINGAIQCVKQLIQVEDVNAAGGSAPAHGITGPGVERILMDAYRKERIINQDISGELRATATTGDTTLVTVKKAAYTLFIQRIIAYFTTSAAVNWSFESATGAVIANIPASPGVDTRWEFDFGAKGKSVDVGQNFVLNVSATGSAGHIEWEGYQRLTAAVDPAST